MLCLLQCGEKSRLSAVSTSEKDIKLCSSAICVLWLFVKHLRIFPLISPELGFLLSVSNDYFACHLVSLWVICCRLPLAQMEIESKLEHGIGVSHLCLLPAHQRVPSFF